MAELSGATVPSDDGTTIGYLELGSGPGVVLLHGAMETAPSHLGLAKALADAFTVYLPDRRGRGTSGPCDGDHAIAQDVADVTAVLAKTGARNVFGVSSGAVIGLHAALALPEIRRLAVYEPPLSLSRATATRYASRLEREYAKGDVAAMLVTGMKGARAGPALLRALPHAALKPMVRAALRKEAQQPSGDEPTMASFAATLRCDFAVVAEANERLDLFAALRADVLLLDGSRSQPYLTAAVDALERIIPGARRVTFDGLDHRGSGNADEDGQPERVAAELRAFFA